MHTINKKLNDMTKGEFILKWLSKPGKYDRINVDEMRKDLDKLIDLYVSGVERPVWLSEELENEALIVFDSGAHLKAVKMLGDRAKLFIDNFVTWSFEYLKKVSDLNKIKNVNSNKS